MRRFLAQLLVDITGHTRYFPEIKWSNKSWTHNTFRVFEYFFGRKYGIRCENATFATRLPTGEMLVQKKIYTFEALLAHIETYIRTLFQYRFSRVRIVNLQLTPSAYFKHQPFFRFAVALDVTTQDSASTTSPNTFSHTCTGTDLLLVFNSHTNSLNGTACVTSAVSYNSVAGTSVRSDSNTTSLASHNSLWLLHNPATGSNTVSATFSGGSVPQQLSGVVSYTGAQQSSTADAHNGTNGTGTGTKTVTVTTVADNCWVFGGIINVGVTGSTSPGQTGRWDDLTCSQGKCSGEDTNTAVTPAGNQDMTFTISTVGTNHSFSACSFAPASAAAGALIVRRRMRMGVGS